MQLDYVFGVTTRRHAAFQAKEMFPWWFRRWILWRRNEPMPQLYHFEDTGVFNEYTKDNEKVQLATNETDGGKAV
jgi:hypothetical protein